MARDIKTPGQPEPQETPVSDQAHVQTQTELPPEPQETPDILLLLNTINTRLERIEAQLARTTGQSASSEHKPTPSFRLTSSGYVQE